MSENEKFLHLIRCKFLTPELIDLIFAESDLMCRVLNYREDVGIRAYRDAIRKEFIDNAIVVASFFVEESLRTRWSFEGAAARLGARVISTENAAKFSSMAKGESLEHSIRVISGLAFPNARYVDLIVLRHTEEGAAKRAMKVSSVPIINAGDGPGEHPTQALLDIYTILKILGRMGDFSIALIGDLLNSRTIHSILYLLSLPHPEFKGIKIYLISHPAYRVKDGLRQHMVSKGVWFKEIVDVKEYKGIMKSVHVAYMTRPQSNRVNWQNQDEVKIFNEARGWFYIDREIADNMLADGIILHPLPIDSANPDYLPEIRPEVDNHPKAMMFREVGFGFVIRMALQKILLENWGFIPRVDPKEYVMD